LRSRAWGSGAIAMGRGVERMRARQPGLAFRDGGLEERFRRAAVGEKGGATVMLVRVNSLSAVTGLIFICLSISDLHKVI